MEVIKFIEQNAEFQRAFGYKVNTTPVRVTEIEKKLRYKLFEEEFIEYQDAFYAGKKGLEYFENKKGITVSVFVEKVDAVCDMLYIETGTINTHGWQNIWRRSTQIQSKTPIPEETYLQLINQCNKNYLRDPEQHHSSVKIMHVLNLAQILNILDILPELYNEVHKSNMSKLDENGKPIINGQNGVHDKTRPIGKVLKSPNFIEPDLESILKKYNKI